MPANLTGSPINSTYNQLLHVNGGPVAEEKTVVSGTGVETALKIGTQSISATVSELTLLDPEQVRGELELGSLATQDSDAVDITGGTITNVIFTGSFTGITLIESDKFSTKNGTDGVSVTNTEIFAEGTSADIDINITPKGTGEVNVTNIDILSGKVPFSTVTGRAYASFSDITDQTGNVSTPTAVKFGTTEVAGSGITMVTDGSNLTRLTFAAAGTYMVAPNLQFVNSDAANHDVTVWLRLDGTDVARSATRVTIPKTGDGGSAFFQIVFYLTVTAGQYVQVMWLPENVAVTLDHGAAAAGPPAVPAIPSAVIVSERIA